MRPVLLASILSLAPVFAIAQGSADAAKQLVAKILEQIPAPSMLHLSLENRASLATGDVEEIRASLDQLLRAGGVELGDSDMELRITIGTDPTRYLLIAQIGSQVAIAAWKKPPAAATEYRTSIQRTRVWEQRDPILDLMFANNGATMLVLEVDRTVEYRKDGVHWQFVRATPNSASVLSRDPRGLFAEAPYRLVRGRNYFDGGERGYFFTVAETSAGQLFAGIDGRTRLYAQRPEPVLVIGNWGDDIAAITSDCGSKGQVLATARTTEDSQDHLQAFEFTGATYSAVSEPLLLAGPVTALWPAESAGQVTLVVHNGQTGMYEASRVSISCAQ